MGKGEDRPTRSKQKNKQSMNKVQLYFTSQKKWKLYKQQTNTQ